MRGVVFPVHLVSYLFSIDIPDTCKLSQNTDTICGQNTVSFFTIPGTGVKGLVLILLGTGMRGVQVGGNASRTPPPEPSKPSVLVLQTFFSRYRRITVCQYLAYLLGLFLFPSSL